MQGQMMPMGGAKTDSDLSSRVVQMCRCLSQTLTDRTWEDAA